MALAIDPSARQVETPAMEQLAVCLMRSWHAWRSLLLATMGEPLNPDELIIHTLHRPHNSAGAAR